MPSVGAMDNASEKMMKERWIKHYSSGHDILLVGEGDFSFSLCLAEAFGSARNIVATSRDSYDALTSKYKNAKSNLASLKRMGAKILHGVDATQMWFHQELGWRKFHRIVFNFPHAGFYGREDDPLLIALHQHLVRGFLRNARCMLWPGGEIHISHKITAPFDSWDIGKLASEFSLSLVACTDFKIKDYPGYNNKRGDGNACDQSFPLKKCRTFKFIETPVYVQNPVPAYGGQPQLSLPNLVPNVHMSAGFPFVNYTTEECRMMFGGYMSHVEDTYVDTSYVVIGNSVSEQLMNSSSGYQHFGRASWFGHPEIGMAGEVITLSY